VGIDCKLKVQFYFSLSHFLHIMHSPASTVSIAGRSYTDVPKYVIHHCKQ